MVTFLVWAATTAYVFARLPWLPTETPDSESYLALDPSRPPAYGWLLNGYLKAKGGEGLEALGGLPLLQTALVALALLAFARQLDRLLGRRWAGSVAVLAVWANAATYEATRWVMSEALFLPAVLLGLALAFAHARRGDAWTLAGCAASFAFAALARNSGAVMLAIPALLALLDGARPAGRRLARVCLAAGVAVLVLAGGMLDTHARHGRFALGSNSGISLLGKGLLLLGAAPDRDPVLAAAAVRAAEARAAVAAAPGLLATMRAQAQAYELLRWPSFFPEAEAAWPAWREGDPAERNAIASRIAKDAIAAAPGRYAALAARDWLGLVLLPHLWPPALGGGNSGHDFFAGCRAAPESCWAFFSLPLPTPYAVSALAVSLGGFVASLAALLVTLPGVLGGGALAPAERVVFALVVAIQGTLLGTALTEAGLWRYTIHVNAMNAAVLAWLAHRALGWVSGRQAVARPARLSGARL